MIKPVNKDFRIAFLHVEEILVPELRIQQPFLQIRFFQNFWGFINIWGFHDFVKSFNRIEFQGVVFIELGVV